MTIRQSFVSTAPARGIPGDSASRNPEVYAVGNPVAWGGPVTVGRFVWLRGTAGSGAPLVGATAGRSGGVPLGIVSRSLTHPADDLAMTSDPEAALCVPEGTSVRVLVNGDVFALSQTAATVSQAVFAHTDGSGLSTADPGTPVEGAVETGWRVSVGGNAGDVIVISNWGWV
ncbi:hypothetical protein IHV25_07480 [Phaeovibrio sulfidiphilus]|uniref:Uncharacterized protein n=1 Tax=Phaeovibrio sulfidiphilus TaxID=1220600 RepID=A0A8J7CPV0_9PROT|nr:hypothetical protein [Phaeovibrio sulfidiphilus]MBE1237487.1 hypothetical protein [Phaeovibrio sulfidiphilus]